MGLKVRVKEDVGGFDVTMNKFSRTAFMEIGQAPGSSFDDP